MITLKVDTSQMQPELSGEVGKYLFEVGVLDDSPHREARPKEEGFKELAGGPALKAGKKSDETTAQIAETLDEIFNWLSKPWRSRDNKEVLEVVDEFSEVMNGKNDNKLRNSIQAVVRNPILRGDYGDNSPETEEKKGFNRLLIATGTFFNKIKANVFKKGR